jgi:uncharacterized membrane protein YbhN (UPF0104 family)
MLERLRPWWPLCKALLAVAIVVGVGLLFARILRSEELQQSDATRTPGRILWDQVRAARPEDLVLAGALYLLGLMFSGVFWHRLLQRVDDPLPLAVSLRTYYISHLGKYAPLGKGWALLLRTSLATAAGVRPGVAALTATYETLTTMACGALLAAVLVTWQAGGDENMIWRALGLLALAGIPILPGVFNRVIARLAARFSAGEALPLPRLGASTLLGGIAFTGCTWALLGASLACVLRALRPEADWDAGEWLRCIAFVAVSYVAGFVASTPGGLGVREFFLQQFLAPYLGGQAVVAAVLLRVLWTVAELLAAGCCWWLPARRTALESPAAPAPEPSP